MASVVVVAAGAALAVSVPFIALKESLESRLRSNMRKHLGARRRRCRVSFHMGDTCQVQAAKFKLATKCSSDDEDSTSTISSPPSYCDISQPPAYNLLVLHSK